MKREIVFLSTAVMASLCSLVCVINYSGQLLSIVGGLFCTVCAALLLGLGLQSIFTASINKLDQNRDQKAVQMDKLFSSLDSLEKLLEAQHEQFMQSSEKNLSEILTALSCCIEQIRVGTSETKNLLSNLQTITSEASKTSLDQFGTLIQAIGSLGETIDENYLKNINTIKELAHGASDRDVEYQEGVITELSGLREQLSSPSGRTVAEDIDSITDYLSKISVNQRDCASKISRSIEDCADDVTEQLGDLCEKIDLDLSTTRDLLSSYSELTEQDAAQIRALLEKSDG